MTVETPQQYLYTLPEPIPERLYLLVRACMDTDDEEKVMTLSVLNGAADTLFVRPGGQKPLELLARVGELIGEIYRAGEAREEVA